MTEKNQEELQVETFEQKKEKMMHELMETPLKLWSSKGTGKKPEVTLGKVKDVITEKDVWFAVDKPRPIITEEGFNKLVRATGAQFPKTIFIEKQSDFGSFERGQVTVEATVFFPGAEEGQQNNTDLGVANPLNCKQDISKANMPIMAVKRAKARAFFRSEYINMVVYDESEVSEDLSKLYKDAINKKNEAERETQQMQQLVLKAENKTAAVTKRSTEFFDLVKQYTQFKGRSIWEMNDLGKMESFFEKNKKDLNPLEERLFEIRLAELKMEQKKKEQEAKDNPAEGTEEPTNNAQGENEQ